MKNKITYIESLKKGLDKLLSKDDVYFLGEDIAEPYGGAFKVSKGLSVKYPEKVLNMPMSEQAIVGMGIGMAIGGMKTIVEIMFGDFITLTLDQLFNHAAKFADLYNIKIHMIVRTPVGGYRGYGSTHSQSLEKIYFGLPGIYVIAPSIIDKPGELLIESLNLSKPVLFIENKLDYTRKLIEDYEQYDILSIESNNSKFPINTIYLKNEDNYDFTMITYGGFVHSAFELQNRLFFEEEINLKIVTISMLSPLDFDSLYKEVKNDEKIIIVEEGHIPYGLGDAILSQLFQKGYRGEAKTFGAKNSVIYSAENLEKDILPNFEEIYNFIVEWN